MDEKVDRRVTLDEYCRRLAVSQKGPPLNNRPPGEGLQDVEAPVLRFLNTAIQDAVRAGATHLYLECGESSGLLRVRRNGEVLREIEYPKFLHPPLLSRIKVMFNMDVAERRKPASNVIDVHVDRREYALKATVFPSRYGEYVQIEIIPYGDTVNLEPVASRLGELLSAGEGVLICQAKFPRTLEGLLAALVNHETLRERLVFAIMPDSVTRMSGRAVVS